MGAFLQLSAGSGQPRPYLAHLPGGRAYFLAIVGEECCLINRQSTSPKSTSPLKDGRVGEVGECIKAHSPTAPRTGKMGEVWARLGEVGEVGEVGSRPAVFGAGAQSENALDAENYAHVYARSEDAIRPCNIADQNVAATPPTAPRPTAHLDPLHLVRGVASAPRSQNRPNSSPSIINERCETLAIAGESTSGKSCIPSRLPPAVCPDRGRP